MVLVSAATCGILQEVKVMKLKAALFIVVATTSALPAHAGSHRSVDARTLDIAGVKTGMDYSEARAAIAAHFHVAPSGIETDPALGVNDVTHTKLPSYLTYEKDGMRFNVSFVGRVPVDKSRPLVVDQIHYEVPWTQQNVQTMAKAALEKYGKPSTVMAGQEEWCLKPDNPMSGCDAGDQATLKLNDVQMDGPIRSGLEQCPNEVH